MDAIPPAMIDRVPFVNSPLMPLLLLSLASQKHTPDTKKYFSKEYDYIVVGAGSAGAALASRLSEVHCVTVLLLEAGSAPPLLTEVPILGPGFTGSEVDWGYSTVVQKYTARAFDGKVIRQPRGKMLGGSSSINGVQYVRGNSKDYDMWAAGGAVGWSYKEVLPYFKKMEDNVVPELQANGFHGVGGPVTVSKPDYAAEIREALFEAHRDLGLQETDSNGPRQTGSFDPQQNMRDGQRCSTAKAYLVPREESPNLDIVADAFVTKVVIEGGRATAVQFDLRGHGYEVSASREVIVSAGAINTPQLLMLSGVGPARELEELGIPVVCDLPVGLNLHDHCGIFVPFELDSNIENIEERLADDRTLKEYINHRSGPLTLNEGLIMTSYVNYDFIRSAVDFPPIQLNFYEASSRIMRGRVGTNKVYRQMYAPYENKTIAVCVPIVLRPKTRGSIRLQSADPYDAPLVDLQYLEHPDDLDSLVEGMKLCQDVIQSRALRRFSSRPFATLFPGCEKVAHDEDGYFRCMAGMVATTGHHQVGTAKMGDPRDAATVVDPQLRVKNIRGLRIVDASVMPKIVSGNTNIPTIMIAEKAADMIKETIKCT